MKGVVQPNIYISLQRVGLRFAHDVLGSFGQNVSARVRFADLPVERNYSPQAEAEVRVGRIGTDLFMVCSYRSRHNKASRFHKIEEPLPNAPERIVRMSAARRVLSGPGCRFAHPS